MRLLLCAALLLASAGCALEKTVDAASDTARAVGMAIIESGELSRLSLAARLENPEYRVFVGLVQGVLMEVGLRGASLDTGAGGSGTGGPGAAVEVLRGDNTDRVLELLRELHRQRQPQE